MRARRALVHPDADRSERTQMPQHAGTGVVEQADVGRVEDACGHVAADGAPVRAIRRAGVERMLTWILRLRMVLGSAPMAHSRNATLCCTSARCATAQSVSWMDKPCLVSRTPEALCRANPFV